MTAALDPPEASQPQQRPRALLGLIGALAVVGVVLIAVFLGTGGAPALELLPWWIVAVLFALGQLIILPLPGTGDRITLSLEDVALGVALLLAGGPALVIGGVLGSLVGELIRGTRVPQKLALNAALTAVGLGLVPLLHRLLLGGAPTISGRGAGALILALFVYSLVSVAAVAGAVVWGEGRRLGHLPAYTAISGVEAALHGSLALVTAFAIAAAPQAALLLPLVFLAALVAFRSTVSLQLQRDQVRSLRSLAARSAATDPEDVLTALLEEARELTGATRAAVTILHPSEVINRHLPPEPPSAEGDALRARCARMGQGVEVNRRRGSPALREDLLPGGVREALGVPFQVGSDGRGLLLVADWRAASRMLPATRQTLATLGEVAGSALQLTRVRQRLHGEVARREHDAGHDALTGLPNRMTFLDGVERAVAVVDSSEGMVGVLLVDINDFGDINAAFGHEVGDRLLEQVAGVLRATVPATSTVARLGADEFAVLLLEVISPDRAVGAAEELRAAVGAPHRIRGTAIEISASCGLVIAPDDGRDASTLLGRAGVAMSLAKHERGGVARYDPAADPSVRERLSMLAALRDAVERDALDVVYQPKLDARSGRVVGAEALVRWTDAARGSVPPSEFIPLAERSGLIIPLTRRVFARALDDVRAWAEDGINLEVAVNLSARSLLDDGLPAELDDLLHTKGVPASAVRIEVTESALIADPEKAAEVLEQLHELGMPIAIDDFGTGYSSLSHLTRLPVDELKIDRSFVARVDRRDEAAIVRATTDMGHGLGLLVTAEGVEDDQIRQACTELGCDVLQGYGLARPMPAPQLRRWLAEHEPGLERGAHHGAPARALGAARDDGVDR